MGDNYGRRDLAFNLQDSYYLNMEEYYVNIHIKNFAGLGGK